MVKTMTIDEAAKYLRENGVKISKETLSDGIQSASGESGNAASSGWMGNAAASGARGTATVTGRDGRASALGEQCIAVAWGNNSLAKGTLGNWIVVSERGISGDIVDAKLARVDGDTIRADTWYTMRRGEIVEVAE